MDNSFQSQNFDPIAYLNQRFPNQASLSGLDDQIQALNKQLQQVNGDLIKQIHEHAMMNVHVSEEIQRARQLSKEVIKQIGIIKQKATKSQEIVYEMCKDLKSLDIAKKNLTFSIDALKKFIMMVDALEKLRDCCQKRIYKEVANLISAFNQLSNYFKKYENIPQIQELYKEKNGIIVELNSQIIQDFQSFEKSNSLLKPEDLAFACQVIEILGDKYHRKFIENICKMILDPYQQLYSQPENALLQNTERRYGWIKRKMEQFDSKFGNAFPQYWGIHCYIYYEFCSLTRLSLTIILEKNSNNLNVAILMKSLEMTLKFEQKITNEMKKKYEKTISANEKETKEFRIVSLPKFKDSISNSFQPHLKPYIKSEEDAMYESLLKNLQEDSLTEIKVYNSSLILFHSIKSVLKRASIYSKGNLIVQIIKVIKKVFKFYCDKCLEKIKKSQDFQTTICWIINTGEHCKNIITGLEEMVETSLDPSLSETINFSDQQELFSNLISKSIQYFINHLDQRFEIIFTQISKVPWQKVDQIVDVSSYVKEAKALLTAHFIKIKDEMNGSYLTFYLNKLIVLINNKFISNVYKCKKLPTIAFQTLHLDIIELKQILLNVVKMDAETFGNQKTLDNYKSFVNKTFLKSENIIKLITLPLENISEKFETFIEGGTLADLDKILLVKGAKRSEVPNLVKMLQNRKQ